MVEMPEQARRWQSRLDVTFPQGCIVASAADPGRSTFPVPRPVVVGMKGLDPVVFVDIPSWGRNFSGTLTGWRVLRESPCTVVKVTMALGEHDSDQLWSSNISEAQARALAGQRQESLELSRRGEVYEGGQ